MNKFGLKDCVIDFIIESARIHNIKRVVLFGSRAKGTYNIKSDIDLAITGDNSLRFQEDVEENCPTLLMFDFIDCNNKISDALQAQIENEGIAIYEQI